jgi:hypothetical protein
LGTPPPTEQRTGEIRADCSGSEFRKGKYYPIVVTGNSKKMPKLQAVMIEDQLTGTPARASNPKQQAEDVKMVKAKASKY